MKSANFFCFCFILYKEKMLSDKKPQLKVEIEDGRSLVLKILKYCYIVVFLFHSYQVTAVSLCLLFKPLTLYIFSNKKRIIKGK